MTNDELQVVIDYVLNEQDFNPEKFQNIWPTDPSTQRLAMGMLATKSYYENKRQNKTNSQQWVLIIFAVVMGTIGAVHVLGVDQFESVITGLVVGAIAQGLKYITLNL